MSQPSVSGDDSTGRENFDCQDKQPGRPSHSNKGRKLALASRRKRKNNKTTSPQEEQAPKQASATVVIPALVKPAYDRLQRLLGTPLDMISFASVSGNVPFAKVELQFGRHLKISMTLSVWRQEKDGIRRKSITRITGWQKLIGDETEQNGRLMHWTTILTERCKNKEGLIIRAPGKTDKDQVMTFSVEGAALDIMQGLAAAENPNFPCFRIW